MGYTNQNVRQFGYVLGVLFLAASQPARARNYVYTYVGAPLSGGTDCLKNATNLTIRLVLPSPIPPNTTYDSFPISWSVSDGVTTRKGKPLGKDVFALADVLEGKKNFINVWYIFMEKLNKKGGLLYLGQTELVNGGSGDGEIALCPDGIQDGTGSGGHVGTWTLPK